jgi:rhodanese-related sulfurtransferase
MLQTIKKLLGFGPGVNYAELVQQGALIIDVRTKGEFSDGHIQTSVNIPVDQLGKNLSKIKDKNRHIITCCASGSRSAAAKGILTSNGFKNVYNGGSWNSLSSKIRQ